MQNLLTNTIPFVVIAITSLLAILVAFLLAKIFRLPPSFVYVAIYIIVGAWTVLLLSVILSRLLPNGNYNNVIIIVWLFVLSVFATMRIRRIFAKEKRSKI